MDTIMLCPSRLWTCCLIAALLAQQAAVIQSLNIKNGSYILSRRNPTNFHQFELYDLEYLEFSPFNASKPIKVIIHGWKGHSTSSIFTLIKNAYLIAHDVNVITVSWDNMSMKNYFSARNYVPKVGQITALMIRDLIHAFRLDPKQIHIVGHSLGGHIAGTAGLILSETGLQIGRITGLDPAGLLFFGFTENRITRTSAAFVDIIHTSKGFAGYAGRLGHVDFYPNGGGPFQPMTSWDFTTLKSHRRAYWLFAESITTPGGFQAIACGSWSKFKKQTCSNNDITEMGEYVSMSARGTYYLTTNSVTPFAKGARSTEYE